METSTQFVKDLNLQFASGASLAVVVTYEDERATE